VKLYGAQRMRADVPPPAELPGGMRIIPQTAWRLRGRMLAYSLAPADLAFGAPVFQVDILFDMSKVFQPLHSMFRPLDLQIRYVRDCEGGAKTRVDFGQQFGTGRLVLMHFLLPVYDRSECLQRELTARIFGRPAEIGEAVEADAWAVCTTLDHGATSGFCTVHFDFEQIGKRVLDRAAGTKETQCPWLIPAAELDRLAAWNAEQAAAERLAA